MIGTSYRGPIRRSQKGKRLQALTSALLNTDRSHKTALTADEKKYLAVYIY
ncbi:unnamed protein product [Staurois parvus]|uniref:Uncharacterized protein n=1 Tax=Staurois parvus TaxID=386267 RepID=A0ABN9GVS4_9NEOB|nr:unnamed protein product [Staurois parvus]